MHTPATASRYAIGHQYAAKPTMMSTAQRARIGKCTKHKSALECLRTTQKWLSHIPVEADIPHKMIEPDIACTEQIELSSLSERLQPPQKLTS